jgi:ankyrin repeat protein
VCIKAQIKQPSIFRRMNALQTATLNALRSVGNVKRPMLMTMLREVLDRRTTDVNTIFKNGIYHDTMLQLAVQHGDIDVVNLLLAYGANPSIVCGELHDAKTCLITCCEFSSHESNKTVIPSTLIDHGANVNARVGCTDSTVLHWACSHGNVEMATMLIKNHADVNAANYTGITPLACTMHVKRRHHEQALQIIRLLWQSGADINSLDRRGNTLLHIMAKSEPPWNMHIAQFLINHGVQDLLNGEGVTAGAIALKRHDRRLSEWRRARLFATGLQNMFDVHMRRLVAFAMGDRQHGATVFRRRPHARSRGVSEVENSLKLTVMNPPSYPHSHTLADIPS